MILFSCAAMTQDLTIRTEPLMAHCTNIIHTRAITRTRDTEGIIRTTITSTARGTTTITTLTEIEVTGPTTPADEAFIMYILLLCTWAR